MLSYSFQVDQFANVAERETAARAMPTTIAK